MIQQKCWTLLDIERSSGCIVRVMQERWVSSTEAARLLGRTTRTLRRYTEEGLLPDVRSHGKRVFRVEDLESLRTTLSGAERRRHGIVTYARATPGPDADQRLAVQQERLKQSADPDDLVASFSDIASGLSDTRPGLRSALDAIVHADARTLLAVHPDRIGLFGATLLEHQLRLIGVQVQYLDGAGPDQQTPDELTAELDTAVSELAGRLYGRRSKRFKDLRAMTRTDVVFPDPALAGSIRLDPDDPGWHR